MASRVYDRLGEMGEVYELLDRIVSDYGILTASADWWLRQPGGDLRVIEVIMAREDVLGTADDPKYVAMFLARTVADKYGY